MNICCVVQETPVELCKNCQGDDPFEAMVTMLLPGLMSTHLSLVTPGAVLFAGSHGSAESLQITLDRGLFLQFCSGLHQSMR